MGDYCRLRTIVGSCVHKSGKNLTAYKDRQGNHFNSVLSDRTGWAQDTRGRWRSMDRSSSGPDHFLEKIGGHLVSGHSGHGSSSDSESPHCNNGCSKSRCSVRQITIGNVPCILFDKAGNNMKISIKNYFSTIFSSKIDTLSGNFCLVGIWPLWH